MGKQLENEELIQSIEQLGIVPLVTLKGEDEALPLADALVKGGIPVAEVTFRSPYALEGMRQIHEQLPEVMLLAGTVHSVDQAKASVEAGCVGIVTPSFDEDVVDWCLENEVMVLPGTAAPSDIEKAYDRGLRRAKFFPAEAYGGVKTLKALSGPFAEMKFLPTGGVNLKNAAEYMIQKNVFAIGGSFPVPSDAQDSHDWDAIVTACKMARSVVDPIVAGKNQDYVIA
ncbi:MAG: bifunctional 4-hydroxy-2-oxoglutarate aldolase/2-dehydro-3-deoxy-phosphogluconate aldolase [Bifidobacteriaceae bacterium]|jgi:2-dehydro-3-deoxyphosphogluconate aldolase/(4S)-4-hydroxy-2-oxoglutarate aldolase|nr:bifunctional 4-hydroxy-2-oxoglutarate aldolase/2-dehydro-3-deoxy-phosphogluconate aldolase [Bifidobacteriaceae bacterium]MCI1914696.1 bifunctional 4-hydroxy-2-oxoglutarate aldolase/2-dehydro-3-deoxy-phosphogluconate aldolase [Bifidobacteriaceae bacterium]MCI1979682.1 bifunctional 4-hydroxy-2-oxoglutarate aldolase/2-dehydro-3-deoxy-phosphogluconate aldolase [Bifidobacteriaceae bacterium]